VAPQVLLLRLVPAVLVVPPDFALLALLVSLLALVVLAHLADPLVLAVRQTPQGR